jgi:hypothetical protein
MPSRRSSSHLLPSEAIAIEAIRQVLWHQRQRIPINRLKRIGEPFCKMFLWIVARTTVRVWAFPPSPCLPASKGSIYDL